MNFQRFSNATGKLTRSNVTRVLFRNVSRDRVFLAGTNVDKGYGVTLADFNEISHARGSTRATIVTGIIAVDGQPIAGKMSAKFEK